MMKLNSAESSDELAAVLQDLDSLAARRVGVLDQFVVSGPPGNGKNCQAGTLYQLLC